MWKRFAAKQLFSKTLAGFRFIVRRIGKHNLEFLRGCGHVFQEPENVLLANPASQLRFAEVFFNRRDRLSIFFDKKSRVGAATKRLDTERTRSGKEIEDPRANHYLAEARENRCFHAVHRWAHTVLRRNEPNAAGATGDHPHGELAGLGAAGDALASGVVGGADSSVFVCAPFFFFGLSLFPPQKLFTRSFRSRPTTFSSKFVLGRSSVPLTSKSTAEYPGSSVGWKFVRIGLKSCARTFSLMASREFKWSLPRKLTVPVAER